MSIGVGHRCPADTLVLPFHLTGNKISRDQRRPDFRAVKSFTNQHCPTDAVRKATRKVDLLRVDSAAVRLYPNQHTANAKGTAVHIFATRHWSEILRRP